MLSGAPTPRFRPFGLVFAAPERWQSGRSRRTRNAEYAQAYRGFESLPLRQSTCHAIDIVVLSLLAIARPHGWPHTSGSLAVQVTSLNRRRGARG